MLKAIHKHSHHHGNCDDSVVLSFEQRKKGRLKTVTLQGHELGLFLERGKVLRHGDVLETDCGQYILVQAADEAVAVASTNDWHNFAKLCYHLGNRHTPLEVGVLEIRFQPDHVLQELCENFGLQVSLLNTSFNPESGAYGSQHEH
ncbi:MAG: urease accessory protein UreE [Pseudomonadales bacterium]